MTLKRNQIILIVIVLVVLTGVLFFFGFPNSSVTKKAGTSSHKQNKHHQSEGSQWDRIGSFGDMMKKHHPRKKNRELTPQQRRENEKEFARMRKKIPGNIYIPGKLSEEEQKERREMMKKIILLGNKVRKGTATTEETKEFYTLKSKEVSDKIDFARYIFQRASEKSSETGEEYFPQRIKDKHSANMKILQDELDSYKKKLSEL
jgi:hypothetical protein